MSTHLNNYDNIRQMITLTFNKLICNYFIQNVKALFGNLNLSGTVQFTLNEVQI